MILNHFFIASPTKFLNAATFELSSFVSDPGEISSEARVDEKHKSQDPVVGHPSFIMRINFYCIFIIWIRSADEEHDDNYQTEQSL